MKKIILVSVLILILIVSGCSDIKTPTRDVINVPSEEAGCPQFIDLKYSFHYEDIDKVWYDEYDVDNGVKDVDGWKIGGGYETWEGYFAQCHKGSKTSENINYYYCGEDRRSPLLAIKRITDSSGNIKDTLEKEIIIIVDKEKKFIETICK